MEIIRRHLPPTVAFAFGVPLLILPLSVLVMAVESPPWDRLTAALAPPAAMVGLAALLGMVFPLHHHLRRRAEWSALAPLLGAGFIASLYLSNVAGNLFWRPVNLLAWPGTLAAAGTYAALTAVVCVVCEAVAAWWLGRAPSDGRPRGWAYEVAALGLLVAFSFWPRTAAAALSDALGWGVRSTLAQAWEDAHLRLAASSALALATTLAPVLLTLAVLWWRADTFSRYRVLALVGTWIAVNAWLGQLHRVTPDLVRDDWLQALVLGTVSGGVAMLYVRLVVARLWRRAGPSERSSPCVNSSR